MMPSHTQRIQKELRPPAQEKKELLGATESGPLFFRESKNSWSRLAVNIGHEIDATSRGRSLLSAIQ